MQMVMGRWAGAWSLIISLVLIMASFENQIKQYQSMEQNSLKYLHLQTGQKNGIEGKAGSVTEKDGKKYDTSAVRRERIKYHKDWQRFVSTTVKSPVAEKTVKE